MIRNNGLRNSLMSFEIQELFQDLEKISLKSNRSDVKIDNPTKKDKFRV